MEIHNLVYPFNERGELDSILDSKPYAVLQKLCKGDKLTTDEKQYVTDKVNDNTYFKDSVALLGMRICFRPFLKKFWFKTKWGDIHEAYAINKTTLREHNKYLYPIKIMEVM